MFKKIIAVMSMVFVLSGLVVGCGTSDKKEESKNEPKTENKATLYELNAGEVGDYGSVINQDNKDYIYYTLPAGRYSVDWVGPEDVPTGMLSVGKKGADNVFEEITRIDFDINKTDEMKNELVVNEGEVIRLSDLSKFRLTPIK